MRLLLLGSGDAIGTPKIGCTCDTCFHAQSTGMQRLRTSLLVSAGGRHILIDTSPDLRMQLLAHGSPHIDAVLWTHGHYDHFAGYSEFYRVQKLPTVYAVQSVLDYVRKQLHFLKIPGCAQEQYKPFTLFGVSFTFVPVYHPPVEAYGLVIEYEEAKIVFTGDTRHDIPEKSMDCMRNADLLFADAIVPGGIKVGKHMNYDEACSLAREVDACSLRCVHMSHMIPWDFPSIGKDGEEFLF